MNSPIRHKLDEINALPNCIDGAQQFLEWYYGEYINHESQFDYDQFYYEDYEIEYPIELTKPLDERESGIGEAMHWIVSNRWDLNVGSGCSPLMYAVGWCDAPMTEFLLLNGANANIWPDMEEEDTIFHKNYYLDDLDIAFLNEKWNRTDKIFVDALLNTATALVTVGGLGDYGGLCLSVDTKMRKISIAGPFYRF